MLSGYACLFFSVVFLLMLQLKGTKDLVETNGHSHEDANVGTTAWCLHFLLDIG